MSTFISQIVQVAGMVTFWLTARVMSGNAVRLLGDLAASAAGVPRAASRFAAVNLDGSPAEQLTVACIGAASAHLPVHARPTGGHRIRS